MLIRRKADWRLGGGSRWLTNRLSTTRPFINLNYATVLPQQANRSVAIVPKELTKTLKLVVKALETLICLGQPQ